MALLVSDPRAVNIEPVRYQVDSYTSLNFEACQRLTKWHDSTTSPVAEGEEPYMHILERSTP